jgi:Tol biopolymer transport system component
MERVWPDVHVGEDVLTRSIAELRKVFADDPRSPQVIDTIRKRGYRLIAPVEPLAAAEEVAVTRQSTPSSSRPDEDGHRASSGRSVRFVGAAVAVFAAIALVVLLRLVTGSDPTATTLAERPARADVPRVAPLTSLPGAERDPALAPDGTRVAYSVIGPDDRTARLFVQLVGDESRRALTDGESEDRYPVFSPDGSRIAFVRRRDGRCDLLVTSVLGGPERRLTPCGSSVGAHMDWSPDGRSLVISDRDAQTSVVRLALVDVESGERRWLTQPRPPARGDVEPAFSPDGRRLAFTRVVGGTVSDVYTFDLESGEERRLTFDNRDVVGQDWSRDGSELIFSSSRGGTYALWSVPAEGGEPRWLTGGSSKIKHPAVSRSAPLVVWEDWLLEINVWEVSLEPGGDEGAQPLIASTQWDFAPHPDPTAERVAFISTRTGESAVFLLDRASGEEHRLSPAGMAVLSPVRWSPDGRLLAFVADADGQLDLHVVAPGDATTRRLTDDAAREVAPAWSADGRSLLVGAYRGGDWQVWRHDLESGASAPAAEPGSYAAQEGPDGSLYWLRADRAGLWKREPSGEAVLVTGDLEPQSWADWTVTGTGVYYLDYDETTGDAVLRFVAGGGETPRTVARLGEVARPGLAVSERDGTVLFSRVDRAECDLMLGENLG